jgi:Na+/H+ antiporter NhaA
MATACRGLAGTGFTTSLFIADHAFAMELDFAAGEKIAVFVARPSCRRIGTALLPKREKLPVPARRSGPMTRGASRRREPD